MSKKQRKYTYFYAVQKDCDEGGHCSTDVALFPKTEEGLNAAYKRLHELNASDPVHRLSIVRKL